MSAPPSRPPSRLPPRLPPRARRDVTWLLKATATPRTVRRDGSEVVVATGNEERCGEEWRGRRVAATLVDGLVARGALRWDGGTLARTPAGGATLRRLLCEPDLDAHAEQHRERVQDTIERDGTPEPVSRNMLESPLDRLALAREKDGAPFLHPEAVEAGRRLRSDFERAHLRARTTMAWEAPASTGSGARGGEGTAMTDSAMAARERFARAVDALGPRLGPALADFVAHERGLTDVERSRGWPVRSGKMLLREALERLAAHYGGARR